jgi:hypothetical protein
MWHAAGVIPRVEDTARACSIRTGGHEQPQPTSEWCGLLRTIPMVLCGRLSDAAMAGSPGSGGIGDGGKLPPLVAGVVQKVDLPILLLQRHDESGVPISYKDYRVEGQGRYTIMTERLSTRDVARRF